MRHLNEILSHSDMQREHILELIEEYLLTHNLKVKTTRAIDSLNAKQMEKLKKILYPVAMDNYDYATDTGPSIYIPEEVILDALQKLGISIGFDNI